MQPYNAWSISLLLLSDFFWRRGRSYSRSFYCCVTSWMAKLFVLVTFCFLLWLLCSLRVTEWEESLSLLHSLTQPIYIEFAKTCAWPSFCHLTFTFAFLRDMLNLFLHVMMSERNLLPSWLFSHTTKTTVNHWESAGVWQCLFPYNVRTVTALFLPGSLKDGNRFVGFSQFYDESILIGSTGTWSTS